jgi:hypothetical protein
VQTPPGQPFDDKQAQSDDVPALYVIRLGGNLLTENKGAILIEFWQL